MHVTDYMNRGGAIGRIKKMHHYYGRKVGLSDHSLTLDNCKIARDSGLVNVIEKHFTLEKNIKYNETVFRDTVHGSTPKEFKELTGVLF
jgi:sialic acid synthase SpsE